MKRSERKSKNLLGKTVCEELTYAAAPPLGGLIIEVGGNINVAKINALEKYLKSSITMSCWQHFWVALE